MHTIPVPLYSGLCDWEIQPQSNANGLLQATGVLKLKINPTRFVRHHPFSRPLPDGIRQNQLAPAAHREIANGLDETDNWLPQDGRLLSLVHSNHWWDHVRRYLTAIEESFAGEVLRAAELTTVRSERTDHRYNIKYVEPIGNGFPKTLGKWFTILPTHLLRSPIGRAKDGRIILRRNVKTNRI